MLDTLGKRMMFFDGGMGTLLQAAGLPAGQLPDTWNLTHGDEVRKIHEAYLAAGAHIIKTNTFCTNALKHPNGEAERIIGAAVALAREAVKNAGGGLVALDIGPTGKLLQPLGDLEFEAAVALFGEVAAAGEAAGADLILIETMSDLYELKAAVLGAKENSSLPVMATVSPDASGRLLTGADITGVAALLEGMGVAALGLNCGLGPKQMLPLLQELGRVTPLPIIINPNAGLPVVKQGCTVFELSPQEFAADMMEMAAAGASLLGGCCGTTPQHIAALVEACKSMKPQQRAVQARTLVCSYGKTVELGERPVIIGERINPTGKARLKQALRDGDMDYVLREGVKQQQCGAEVLDVNAGLPELDEAAVVKRIVTELQAVLDLPLQIDTSDPEVLSQALRVYNGKALINSVNGKQESMERVFPLVKKYGGVMVALTLDESGIPETAEGRVEIAKRIIARAEEYGISRKDIIVDALTMTISTGADNANVTLSALHQIRKLGVGAVLGVSNVSFGLPQRETVNAAFLAMAMQNGLSAAIMNPCAPAMLGAFRAAAALCGKDERCESYIALAAENGEAPAQKNAAGELTLEQTIEKGMAAAAREAATVALGEISPLELVECRLVPALDAVGKRYERGEAYLPQLLMSADAAREAFEVVRAALAKSGEAGGKKGRILLATVHGDIHDIGKNIVKVLLQNYGFDVVDLGKDVPEETVVREAQKQNAVLVGLSALMTTTVGAMERTIQLLKSEAPNCRIMVGGAVLSREYAEKIGADHYCKDAMASVECAQQIVDG